MLRKYLLSPLVRRRILFNENEARGFGFDCGGARSDWLVLFSIVRRVGEILEDQYLRPTGASHY